MVFFWRSLSWALCGVDLTVLMQRLPNHHCGALHMVRSSKANISGHIGTKLLMARKTLVWIVMPCECPKPSVDLQI